MRASLSLVSARGVASSRTIAGFLQRLPMFARVSRQAIERLSVSLELRRMERGRTLWCVGDQEDLVCWVRSGVVCVEQETASDRSVTIGYFGRGELLGLQSTHASKGRRDAASIHDDAALLTISRAAFDDWLASCPSAVPAVLDVVATRFARMQQRLALVSMHGAKGRLAALLMDLTERFGVRDSRGIILDLRLTHRELASMIGATRETVSVAMVELRQQGVVRTEHRRIIIVDELGLSAKAGVSP